ncbi:MAG: hypothetical protein IV100_22440 [Myxococcales bacterium]|nr:hypothetical protein [Myxococcales bacterium]
MSSQARTSLWLLTLVVGLVALAAAGYQRYLAPLPHPELQTSTSAQVAPALTKRLVLVLVDSLREDAAQDPTVLPIFSSFAAQGASGINITPPVTLTALSVATIGTGMTPPIAWSVQNFDAASLDGETLFSLLRASRSGDPRRQIAFLGDASWTQLYGAHADFTLPFRDTGFYSDLEGGMLPQDRETLGRARTILADPSYAFVVIHLVGSDKIAHRYGAHLREPDGHLSEYAEVIGRIGKEVEGLRARFDDPETTWLVISDHGCTRFGNHGGGEDEARRAPFAIVGPGINAGARVEQPLTAMAGTLGALFGVRAPATAEAPPAFGIMNHTPAAERSLAEAHVAARRAYVGAIVTAATNDAGRSPGGDDADDLFPVAASPFAVDTWAVHQLHRIGQKLAALDASRVWFRLAGLFIGGLLVLALLRSTLRSLRIPRATRTSFVVVLGAWLALFAFSSEARNLVLSASGVADLPGLSGTLGWTAIGLIVLVGLRSRLVPTAALPWLLFVFGATALTVVVLRYPYGPLPLVFRSASLAIAWGWACHGALRRRSETSSRLFAAIGLSLFNAFTVTWLQADDARFEDDGTSRVLAAVAFGGLSLTLAVFTLLGRAAGGLDRRSGPRRLLVAAVLLLSVSAFVIRALDVVPAVRVFLGSWVLLAIVIASSGLTFSRTERLWLLVVLALAVYRLLALDIRVVAVVLIAATGLVAVPALRKAPAAALVLVAALVQHSLFHELGYSFSFSALDVTVAFAATRDAINLGEGFVFLLFQHLGPWLIVASILVLSWRDERPATGASDVSRPRAATTALLCVFALQAWSTFVSFEYETSNHWFTLHAVPLVIFVTCNALLSGLALLLAGLADPTRGQPKPAAAS